MPFSGINRRSRSDEKEVILERQQFSAQVDAVGRSATNIDTARIVFTDGESHVVQTWTIEEGVVGVHYHDVHMSPSTPKIFVAYSVIARVEPYDQRKMTS